MLHLPHVKPFNTLSSRWEYKDYTQYRVHSPAGNRDLVCVALISIHTIVYIIFSSNCEWFQFHMLTKINELLLAMKTQMR